MPPLRIKYLQSIMKKDSPDKNKKRVSFDNQRPVVFNIPALEVEEEVRVDEVAVNNAVKENNSATPESASDVPVETENRKTKKRPTGASIPIAKRPRRASTTAINYVEPIAFPVYIEKVKNTNNNNQQDKLKSPPAKKQKVSRPKKQSKLSFNTSLPAQLPMVQLPSGSPPPLTLMSGSGDNLLSTSLTTNSTQSSNINIPANQSKRAQASFFAKDIFGNIRGSASGQTNEQTPPMKTEPPSTPTKSLARSPNTRARRLSFDLPPLTSIPTNAGLNTTNPARQVVKPMANRRAAKIGANRRKTMDPGTQSNQEFKLRVVSIDKLRDPNPQFDLLLRQGSFVPKPFHFQST